MKIRNIIFVFLGIILVASFIIILSFCGDPIINKTKSEEVLIQKYDEYANNPKNRLTKIDLNQPNDKLFEIGLDLLNNKYDIINAEKVFRHLESKDPNNPKYQYYKGRSSFFIGEFNYFPNQRDSYDVAYAEFVKLTATYPSNTDYLLMKSYAAGRIGLFIRQKDGLLKAFSKLMESSNLINTILAREPDHTDALLTKGEIEYENPLGSKSEALKIYNYVSDKYPNNLRAKVLISKYYFKTAHEK
ncbi:MAG: hypothetical protein OEV44_09155, partial [Spirochaetota bacterium]|nr:hypothetical protein [Spirochaetota bacterium]